MRHRVFELRQYTLRPGQREVLISLFDRVFVEPQEEVGMRVVGQFRDLDRPDHFVWVRSFPDMVAREAALRGFYGGGVWKAHREAANATMLDSDDVLLLRPAGRKEPFGRLDAAVRPGPEAEARSTSLVLGTVLLLSAPVDETFLRFFDEQVRPVLTDCGGPPRACLQTEDAENTFPQLPVRSGEHAFVWFSSFPSQERWSAYEGELERSLEWNTEVLPRLQPFLRLPPQRLRLEPSARSLLR
jgi:NIPSNAP